MATADEESKTSSELSDLDSSSDESSNEATANDDSSAATPKPVEWLATSRAKRSTAGNRMKSMLANETPADQDSDLELLFAEDENDVGFSDVEHESDVQMDSSSDDEDQDENADDLAGEKELERQAREKRSAQRKRKAQEAIPAKFRKKVRIEQPATVTASASPSSTPAPPAHRPRPKKKSERMSWLPSPADMPTRASERQTTRISKQQLHQKMVTDEIKRRKQQERNEKKAKLLEALKKPPMTQAERLAEAAVVEKRNAKSLNRWEAAEKQREEERLRKIAALNSRKLDGPVVTFWSGIQELEEGQMKHVGNLVSMEERAPRKKRQTAADKAAAEAAAKEAESAKAQDANKAPSPPKEGDEKPADDPTKAKTEDSLAGVNSAAPPGDAMQVDGPSVKETLPPAPVPEPVPAAAAAPTPAPAVAPAPAAEPVPKQEQVLPVAAAPTPAPVLAPVQAPTLPSAPAFVSPTVPTSAMAPLATPTLGSPPVQVPAPLSPLVQPSTPTSAPAEQPPPQPAQVPAPNSAPLAMALPAAAPSAALLPSSLESRPAASGVLAAPILAPPAGMAPPMLGGPMPMMGLSAPNLLAQPNASSSAGLSFSAPPSLPAAAVHQQPAPTPPTPPAPAAAPAPVSVPAPASAPPASLPAPRTTVPPPPLPPPLNTTTALQSRSTVQPPSAKTVDTLMDPPQSAALSSAVPQSAMPESAVPLSAAPTSAAPLTAVTPSGPPREGKVTRSCIILQNFDDEAIKDRQVQAQILFGRKMNRLAKPAQPALCVITNQPAKYRDPKTGLPYSNTYAYREIQRAFRGDYKWSSLAEAYVGSTTFAARRAPERFTDPTKPRAKVDEPKFVPIDDGAEEGKGGTKAQEPVVKKEEMTVEEQRVTEKPAVTGARLVPIADTPRKNTPPAAAVTGARLVLIEDTKEPALGPQSQQLPAAAPQLPQSLPGTQPP